MAHLLLSHHPQPSRIRPTKSTPNLRPKTPTHASHQPHTPSSVLGAVRRGLREASDSWQSWRDGLTREERVKRQVQDERRQVLVVRMRNAETHKQWEASAAELDLVEGNDRWKRDNYTPDADYYPELILQRLRELDQARANADLRSMMHLIRTSLSRDLGGMGNVDLYRHSYTGTKTLIERYVDSTLQTIESIVSYSGVDPEMQTKELLEGMLYSRQAFGRSALLLSGGGTYGMTHVGVLKALFDADLLPRIISGASAGSIVCSVLCTRTDEEVPQLIREFPYGDLAVFGSEEDGVFGNLRRLLTEGSWSDISHLSGVMRSLTAEMTFQEAYNRTRRILNICVSTASIYELPRLLNYVTAPNVMIWSAVAASCSVPLVFNASPLLVKDPLTGEHRPWIPTPQHYIDGSVDNDLPMTRLAEMFNVNHFIVSQVNPHVVPFLHKDDHLSPEMHRTENQRRRAQQALSTDDLDWTYTLTTLARDETLHRLQFLTEMNILPNLFTKLRSVLSQKYSGDITILPEISMHDLPGLLSNPTVGFMLRSCLVGERATWPKLSRIRDRCAIELALDKAVHKLRTRVVFSASQSDLRTLQPSQQPQTLHHQRHPSQPLPTKTKRHRRRSGGSVQLAERRARMMGIDSKAGFDDLTGDDTNGEQQAVRKGMLKRASRSQVNFSLRQLLVTTPEDAPRAHYFASPPPPVENGYISPQVLSSDTSEDRTRMSGPAEGDGDRDLETSEITELGQSSDTWHADGELGTDESELDEGHEDKA